MNYNEMAKEYKNSADEILKKIDMLKAQKADNYGIALKELNRRIKMLEEMYIDCNFTAKIMAARANKYIWFCKGDYNA